MSHQTRWSGTHNNVTRAPWRALVEHSIHWRCYTHHQCSAPFHEMLGRRAERNGIQFRTTKFHSFGDSAIRCSTASKLRNLSHVRVVVQAPERALQFRYVPTPNLVRSVRDQFGTHPGRVGRLCTPLPDRPGRAEQPVHRGTVSYTHLTLPTKR